MKAWKENATLKDPVKEKGQSLKKFIINIIELPLKNTLEFSFGPSL
jgi:hypothetical protein